MTDLSGSAGDLALGLGLLRSGLLVLPFLGLLRVQLQGDTGHGEVRQATARP